MDLPYELDEYGWSILPTLTPGDRMIYVATVAQGGSNANDGLSELTPKATVAAGKALQRAGTGDRLHLKCDGTWAESYGSFAGNGRSTSDRLVVTSWGTGARPILDTTANAFGTQFGSTRNFLAIIGIETAHSAYAGTGSPSFIAFGGNAGEGDVLIEGCVDRNSRLCIDAGNSAVAKVNIAIRRCIFDRPYHVSASDAAHGMLLAGFTGIWIEECIAINCGHNDDVPGAVMSDNRHAYYLQSNNVDVTFRRNIAIDASATGVQFRNEGECFNNLFVRNPTHIHFGGGTSPVSGGVAVNATHNVCIDAIDGATSHGDAINVYNIKAPSTFQHNLIAHKTAGSIARTWSIFGDSSGSQIHGLLFRDNVVYGWGGITQLIGSGAQLAGTAVERFQIDSEDAGAKLLIYSTLSGAQAITHAANRLTRTGATNWFTLTGGSPSDCTFAQLVPQIGPQPGGDVTSTTAAHSYPDPTRDIARYCDEVLELADPTIDGLIVELLAREYGEDWDDELGAAQINQWIRDGFGMPDPDAVFAETAAVAAVIASPPVHTF